MSLDHRLIDLLVCPVCKGPLTMLRDEESRPHELACPADRLAFPIRDGIPVMLEGEARSLDSAPAAPPEPPGAAGAPGAAVDATSAAESATSAAPAVAAPSVPAA